MGRKSPLCNSDSYEGHVWQAKGPVSETLILELTCDCGKIKTEKEFSKEKKTKFKFYASHYGHYGDVRFTFPTLKELYEWDKAMKPNRIVRIVGFINALDGYTGQLYLDKKNQVRVKF